MEDERCCGSGTCIINAEGRCWCGQQWDGTSMKFPKPEEGTTKEGTTTQASTADGDGTGGLPKSINQKPL
jgi:hypothetical protein